MSGAEAGMHGTIDRIDAWFGRRFTRLEQLGEQLLGVLRFDAAARIELTESARRRLKSVAVRYLAEDPVLDGCGLIFAHSALGTENGHLEWWVREDETRFARYSFGVVPGGDRYYDYDHHEWFTRAFDEGTAALVGPYIDYLGVEAYVVTLTVPAELDGRRIGAVGNDIQVQDLERDLLPVLLRAPAEAAVLGAHGHVLVGTSSRFLAGDHVPAETPGYRSAPVGPASAGLRILYAAE
ncbi:cache domain-containing protein [Leucobacter allii]|uniref:cache domain-containing protein n=1 Tax=Leucobacter allii TaxID=2932247 RepID=UPI001FD22CE2|nr:cache domain-containing protein [Leucobacter allii]UOR02690.1 cache domain-containing protein [Leucobacter allii]